MHMVQPMNISNLLKVLGRISDFVLLEAQILC